jgi:hypothetical protein
MLINLLSLWPALRPIATCAPLLPPWPLFWVCGLFCPPALCSPLSPCGFASGFGGVRLRASTRAGTHGANSRPQKKHRRWPPLRYTGGGPPPPQRPRPTKIKTPTSTVLSNYYWPITPVAPRACSPRFGDRSKRLRWREEVPWCSPP